MRVSSPTPGSFALRRIIAAAAVLALALSALPLAAAATSTQRDDSIIFASALSGNRSIWSVRADGSGLTRLTAPPKPATRCDCRFGEFDSHAVASPDGRSIGFTRGARVLVMRPTGDDVRLVRAPAGAEDFDPVWSKTGRLAFIRQRLATGGPGHVHEIISVDRMGRDQKVVVPASRYAFRSLGWSPDGRTLAFTVPYADGSSEFAVGLFILPPDRSRPRFLLRAAGMGEFGWSPDGTTIVLAASVPGAEPYDPYRLFTIRIADRRIVQLTRVPFSKTLDGEPRWSPDGKQIVFSRSDPRRSAIYTVRPDGSGERRVVGDARGAAWSRDGRRLAFVDGVSGNGRRLTLSVISMPDGKVLMRTPLRRPLDADGLAAQAWRR